MNRPNAGIRSKVPGTIPDHAASYGDFGKWIIPVDFDVRVLFIILQAHVEVRAVLLDQVHLKDQGFKLGIDYNPIDVGDLADERLVHRHFVAHRRFETWRRTSFERRADRLRQVASVLEERTEEWAELMAAEMGKPVREGRAELAKSAWVCR